jgi:hypothetical protein
MMNTKKKIRKKYKLASNLGPFKQALAAGLNLELLPLGAEISYEGPKSYSSMMKFEQEKNASCSMCGSYIENSHPKYKLAPQLPSQRSSPKSADEKKNLKIENKTSRHPI